MPQEALPALLAAQATGTVPGVVSRFGDNWEASCESFKIFLQRVRGSNANSGTYTSCGYNASVPILRNIAGPSPQKTHAYGNRWKR